jgi:hypothetical protein
MTSIGIVPSGRSGLLQQIGVRQASKGLLGLIDGEQSAGHGADTTGLQRIVCRRAQPATQLAQRIANAAGPGWRHCALHEVADEIAEACHCVPVRCVVATSGRCLQPDGWMTCRAPRAGDERVGFD